jgi:AcrR family transcriptional regulator
MEDGYHHGALREALVGAALELLREEQPLSLRAVARRAGVSHAAPYHHFADRRALVGAVAREGLRGLRSAVLAGAEGEEDPGRQLLAAGVGYVRFALENRPLFRLMFSAELANREDLPELREAHRELRSALLEMAGRRLGPDTEADEVGFWVLRGWSSVHGLANLILDNQVPGVTTVEEAERLTRRMLLAGERAMAR